MVRYYKEDKDVQQDKELQAYLNELSLNGTGPNGGIGRVNMTFIYTYLLYYEHQNQVRKLKLVMS